MSMLERLAEVVTDLLREDPRRVLAGEDVRDGGMLGLSRTAALDEELAARLIATPLVPSVAIAHAAGLAASGARPILILPSAGALLDGLPALREAAQLRWRSGDQRSEAAFGAGFDACRGFDECARGRGAQKPRGGGGQRVRHHRSLDFRQVVMFIQQSGPCRHPNEGPHGIHECQDEEHQHDG